MVAYDCDRHEPGGSVCVCSVSPSDIELNPRPSSRRGFTCPWVRPLLGGSAGFSEYAVSLCTRDLHDVVEGAAPVGDAAQAAFPSFSRHRHDRLRRSPSAISSAATRPAPSIRGPGRGCPWRSSKHSNCAGSWTCTAWTASASACRRRRSGPCRTRGISRRAPTSSTQRSTGRGGVMALHERVHAARPAGGPPLPSQQKD